MEVKWILKKGRYGHGRTKHAVFGHFTSSGPLCKTTFVYQVSGEYAMMKATSMQGQDWDKCIERVWSR